MKKTILQFLLAFICVLAHAQNNDITLVVDGEGPTKEEATKNALRSAIEQAYGVFVSSNTEILNDELIKDEIATVASGNIKSYNELSSRTLPDGNISVSLSAVVSTGKLISYAKSKGASAEFAGQSFMMEMRMIELNKENESKALTHLLKECKSIDQSIFDCKVTIGEAKISSAIISKWSELNGFFDLAKVGNEYHGKLPITHGYSVPVTVVVSKNKNYTIWLNKIYNVLDALSLSPNDRKMFEKHSIPYRRLTIDKFKDGDEEKTYYLRSNSDDILKLTKTIVEQINAARLSWEIEEKGIGNRYHPVFNYVENGSSFINWKKETLAYVINNNPKLSDDEVFMRGGGSGYTGQEQKFKVPYYDNFCLKNSEKNQIYIFDSHSAALNLASYGTAKSWIAGIDRDVVRISSNIRYFSANFPFELFYTGDQLSLIKGFETKMVPLPYSLSLQPIIQEGESILKDFLISETERQTNSVKTLFVSNLDSGNWSDWKDCHSTISFDSKSSSIVFSFLKDKDGQYSVDKYQEWEEDKDGWKRVMIDCLNTKGDKITIKLRRKGNDRQVYILPKPGNLRSFCLQIQKPQTSNTANRTSADESRSGKSNIQSTSSSSAPENKAKYSVTVLSDPAIDVLPVRECEPIPYGEADSAPRFNGGNTNEFIKWMNSLLEYPQEDKENGIQGRVNFQFTVTAEGTVQDIKVTRGVSPSLDEEAVRVVSLSPKWIPATKDGCRIPVIVKTSCIFQLR